MKKETRYRYEQRIKKLENENRALKRYQVAFRNIFAVACDCADEKQHVKNSYILRQAKDVMPYF